MTITEQAGLYLDFDAFLRSIKQNLDGSFAGKELIAILKTIPYQMYI